MLRALFKYRFKVKLDRNERRRTLTNCSVGIIGAPISKGQTKSGVESGPSAIRKWGLVTELQNLGIPVQDYGDLEFDNVRDGDNFKKVRFPLHIGSACEKISNAVKKVLESNKTCLTLGGDHSIAIGTVHGHSQVHKEVSLLWVDAHSDINTEATTQSGNIHGMSCSFLLKELKKYKPTQLPGFEWLTPCISRKRIAYIGLRDIDPLEKLILNREEITHYSMRDIDHLGIAEVTHRALKAINPEGNRSLHVSFDIDSMDLTVAPSTGTPVLGGLSLREALYLAEEVASTNTMNAVDLVEVNPNIGTAEQVQKTVSAAVLVIKTLFGYSRSGCCPRDVSKIPVV